MSDSYSLRSIDSDLSKMIEVPAGHLAIAYLGQAGFCLKTQSGRMLAIDPYLSDCVDRIAGFKRMIPSVLSPEHLDADIMLATHSHPDHLDEDALPVFAKRPNMFFVGAGDCKSLYQSSGIPASRYAILRDGEEIRIKDILIRATYADHGTLSPEAVGYLISIDGINIYNVGDSAYAPDRIRESLGNVAIDVMIAPINGAYGNLNAKEACMLAALLKPKILIASHFWMFVEHGGDPALFLEESKRLSGIKSIVMAPGEVMIVEV